MSIISKEHYYSADIFKSEGELIFNQEWLYVGIKSAIPNKRDWIVIEVIGKSVIVYNNGSNIQAFQNVCPHRFNKIFTLDSGNGPLTCKYHLWSFDSNEGRLIGTKDVYPETTVKTGLKTYNTELVGNFIFINLNPNPSKTLNQQLGEDTSSYLNKLSEILEKKIYGQVLEHNCNWKFIVENVIERQHCLALHKETLVKAGFCILPPVSKRMLKNSDFTMTISNETTEKKRAFIVRHLFGNSFVNLGIYKHTFVFPNLLISDFEGVNFNIATINPINEKKTNFNMHFFLAKTTSDNKEMLMQYENTTIEFGKKVFEEDKAVLEYLQIGVNEIDHDGYQYNSENRIDWFNQAYKHSLNSDGIN